MINIDFKNWLSILEGWDQVDAAKISNNRELGKIFQLEYNWFGILLQMAKRSVRGGDILTLAGMVAGEIIKDFTTNPRLIAQINELPDENSKIRLFTTAAMLRTRKMASEFTRGQKNRNVHISSFDKKDADNSSPYQIADEKPAFGNDLEDLKRYVLEELDKMEQEAHGSSAKARLQLTKQIAVERMRDANVGQFPGLAELMEKFPQVGKTTMFNIIKDIQTAFARVVKRFGMANIAKSIDQYDANPRGGPARKAI